MAVRIPLDTLRDRIADAIAGAVKAYDVPKVCYCNGATLGEDRIMEPLVRWSVGMIISLVLGLVVTGPTLKWMRAKYKIDTEVRTADRVPAWLIGLIERLFFTIAVAFEIPSTTVAMVAWISVKMLSNWNRSPSPNQPDVSGVAMTALLGGILSMLFALIGGLIISFGKFSLPSCTW